MRELDDKNLADAKVKEKICTFCRNPKKVRITRTALIDIGLLGLNKNGVLELLLEHIESKRRVFTDQMDLRGHPKPANEGHFKTGQTKSPERLLNVGCGKAGSPAALGIAERFPLSHNLNNSIILLD